MKTPRNHAWIAKLAVSLAILVTLAFVVDFGALSEAAAHMTVTGVLIVLVLIPLSMGLRAIRFWLLIGRSISFWATVRITLVGETMNIFLPASSGDIAKAYYGVREHGKKELIITATLIDKVSGLIGLLLLGALAALLHGYTLLGIGFACAGVAGAAVLFMPALLPWKLLERITSRIKPGAINIQSLRGAFSSNPLQKGIALGISLIAWIVSYVQLYFIARLFGLTLEPLFLFSVAPLINLSRLVPFAFAGLGVQEGVTVSLFRLAGIPAATAVAVSLTATLCGTILPGLVGLYFFLRMKKA